MEAWRRVIDWGTPLAEPDIVNAWRVQSMDPHENLICVLFVEVCRLVCCRLPERVRGSDFLCHSHDLHFALRQMFVVSLGGRSWGS